MAAPAWTPTEYGKVATMLQRGASAGEIGNAMKISRNAATGRIMRDPFLAGLWHKHHLGKGGSHPNNLARATSPRLADIAPRHPPKPKPAPAAAPVPHHGDWKDWEEREMVATRRPTAGIPLVELGLCQCHWPTAEDPEHRGRHYFCGLAIAPGEMYCEPHRRKAVA